MNKTLEIIHRLTGASATIIDRFTGERQTGYIVDAGEAWTLLDVDSTVDNGKLTYEFPGVKMIFDDPSLAALFN